MAIVSASPVTAHECSADEDDPSDCYDPCTNGEDHHHFVDNDWPEENYECTSTAPAPGQYQCSDGEDNDGDTLVDGADINCNSTTDNWEGMGSSVNDIIEVLGWGVIWDAQELVIRKLENSVLDTDDDSFGRVDALCDAANVGACGNNNDAAEGPAQALWRLVQQAGPAPVTDGLQGPPAPPWLG